MKKQVGTLYRFLVPLGLLGISAWVWNHNLTATEVIAFSFVDELVPSTRGDPQAMGKVSVWILLGLTAASGGWNGWREVRHRRAQERLR